MGEHLPAATRPQHRFGGISQVRVGVGRAEVMPSLGALRSVFSLWCAGRETLNLYPDAGDCSFAFVARLFLQAHSCDCHFARSWSKELPMLLGGMDAQRTALVRGWVLLLVQE